MIDENELGLDILSDSDDQIKPGKNSKLEMIIPPGATRVLTGLEFVSRPDVLSEDLIYNINSRLPPGFATIERPPFGPQLEFTQYDIDHGDVIVKTTPAWPGHDLTFDFFVSDNEGTVFKNTKNPENTTNPENQKNLKNPRKFSEIPKSAKIQKSQKIKNFENTENKKT